MIVRDELFISVPGFADLVPIEVHSWGVRLLRHENKMGRSVFWNQPYDFPLQSDGSLRMSDPKRPATYIWHHQGGAYAPHPQALKINETFSSGLLSWWSCQPNWLILQMRRDEVADKLNQNGIEQHDLALKMQMLRTKWEQLEKEWKEIDQQLNEAYARWRAPAHSEAQKAA